MNHKKTYLGTQIATLQLSDKSLSQATWVKLVTVGGTVTGPIEILKAFHFSLVKLDKCFEDRHCP